MSCRCSSCCRCVWLRGCCYPMQVCVASWLLFFLLQVCVSSWLLFFLLQVYVSSWPLSSHASCVCSFVAGRCPPCSRCRQSFEAPAAYCIRAPRQGLYVATLCGGGVHQGMFNHRIFFNMLFLYLSII